MKQGPEKLVRENPAQRPIKSTSSDGVSELKSRSCDPALKIRVAIRLFETVSLFRNFRSKKYNFFEARPLSVRLTVFRKLTVLDMRRYSPQYYSPPRRSYGGGGGGGGGRGRSPPRRRKEQNNGTFLNFLCREPRGFAFIQFVDSYEAAEAQYHMNGKIFAGREISVVVAAETRKRPEEMRQRTRVREPSDHGGRRSSYYGMFLLTDVHVLVHALHTIHQVLEVGTAQVLGHPVMQVDTLTNNFLRSYSPAPRRRGDSISPSRRRRDNPRSPRDLPPVRDGDRRPYSPGYDNVAGPNENGDGYDKKPMREEKDGRDHWRSPDRASRSPSGSRSRSAELSPARSR
ncbi:hypothetical protein C1H46_029247 [Malus baccata]|uniref:RRM domain-containing protein n=1 Tax=Malus baccata TaxID=106549 RepID=A0A540LFP5_MALBA|nr:hypothetical protein C1H46_029247 [Malus baccata]